MEIESKNQLPFLDVLIQKNGVNLRTKVYRKPTHTGRYLHYDSNHHNSVKKGVARCLYDRAKIICSDVEDLRREKDTIRETLKSNGYPNRTINLTFDRVDRNTSRQERPTPKCTAVIPYIRGVSDKLRRIGNRYNIRTAFKTTTTLRGMITNTKPHNEDQCTKNCIYNVPCECGRSYIGETKRPLRVRIAEHKQHMRKGEIEKSNIAKHVWEQGHRMQWDNTTIIAKEQHSYRRKLKEASYIALTQDAISQASTEIKPIWIPLLRRELQK